MHVTRRGASMVVPGGRRAIRSQNHRRITVPVHPTIHVLTVPFRPTSVTGVNRTMPVMLWGAGTVVQSVLIATRTTDVVGKSQNPSQVPSFQSP